MSKKMKAALMLAVNPEAKREKNDFYATDPYAIYKMKSMFEELGLDKDVWECACGNGHLSKPLTELGYNVYSSDLVKRDFPCDEVDFLDMSIPKIEGSKIEETLDIEGNFDILTNPPFKMADQFIEKALSLVSPQNKVWMFLKIQFLETEKRRELFKKNGLRYVVINSSRVCCAKDGNFDKYFKQDEKTGAYRGGTQCYCWFVFQKEYKDDPVIKFV